jgi:hypothetical protein
MLLTPKFGIGHVFVAPNGGLQPSGASGTELSTIQDFSVDFSGKEVELRGQFLYPVDARVADISLKGKFKVGEWSLEQLSNLFIAGTLNTSPEQIVADEAGTPMGAGSPPSAPYSYTVTKNPSSVSQILTIAYASNGSNLDEVGTNPPTLAGTYYVSTGGEIIFSAGDALVPMLFSYVTTGGTGASLSIGNNLQGQSPIVSIAGVNAADGSGWLFPNCRVTGIKPLDLKNNAYAMNEVSFSVFCPAGQAVGQLFQQTV